MVRSVRKPTQPLLSPPNPGASTVYTLTSKAIALVVPIARDLYQRGSLMRTRGGSAASPRTTLSLLSFSGTSRPYFHHIPETWLTFPFLPFISIPRLRPVLFFCCSYGLQS